MSSLIYFLIWAAAFFLMMRFGCGAHIMGHGHGHAPGQADDPPSTDAAVTAPPPRTAVDPVCGMEVQTADAKTLISKGRVIYFCSPVCRDKFEAQPQSFPPREIGSPPMKELAHAR